jgi:hypothetical protein
MFYGACGLDVCSPNKVINVMWPPDCPDLFEMVSFRSGNWERDLIQALLP